MNGFSDLAELNMTLNSMESALSHCRVSDFYKEIDQWLSDLCKPSNVLIQNMKLIRADLCGLTLLNYLCSCKIQMVSVHTVSWIPLPG